MRQLATMALIVLIVIVSAVYLPLLYEKMFFTRVEKTHLLFSPVSKQFIYKEKIVGAIPSEAIQKAEDHHAEIAYRNDAGAWFTRVEFEKRLPFIYYKNMELWGLMPLVLEGRSFDKAAIKKNRQVLELKPDEINGNRPVTPLWPLLESEPGQARLVFPTERFRMTADAMQFVNADYNRIDPDLTAMFTSALKDQGFAFPARSVNGKFTILKPFDEGIFLVDANYRVFHVKRRKGKPVVVRTGIDPKLKTRHIKISENRRREYYGLLLAQDHSLYLLTYDNYRLIRLPLEQYNPDGMDFKLIVNPLYRTAVWSDKAIIRGVAMNTAYQPIKRYNHEMSRAKLTPMHRVHEIMFPFSLHPETTRSGYMRLALIPGGWLSLTGLLASLALFTAGFRIKKGKLPNIASIGLITVTGIYGIAALFFLGIES